MRQHIVSKIIELKNPENIVIKEEKLHADRLKADEILAETIYSAVSPGTEVAAYKGDPPLRPGKAYPRLVGYCNVAKIIAAGHDVARYSPGDHILTFQSHRSAFICSEESIICKISDGDDLAAAATTYLFHLGYDALLKGGVTAGHNIAVVGLGTIGLNAVALGGLFGANVYGFSNQAASSELAAEFGARKVFKKDNHQVTDIINRETGESGIDIVVSTSNSWADWKLAIRLARRGGKVCVVGFPGRTDPIPDFNPLDSQFFYDKQLTLIACGYTPDYVIDARDIRFTIKRNCQFLLNLILEKKLPARKIISSTFDWQQIQSVYDAIAERKAHFLSGVLQWKKSDD